MSMTFGIIVSVWLLLPSADDGLRALMLMLYVWYIATIILARIIHRTVCLGVASVA